MTVSVLVVDDSGFFRKRLTEILTASGQIKVIGAATNGREGVELAEKLRPDVITMDYEMPVMDGISAVREIMRKHPTPVLMFSSGWDSPEEHKSRCHGKATASAWSQCSPREAVSSLRS